MSEKALIPKDENSISEDLKKLIQIIKTVKHGSVTLIIQDGKIVQIEKNQKMRLR